MTTPTTSGWYEDPQDASQLRYFDGLTWTRTAVPKAVPQPVPSAPVAASVPADYRQAQTNPNEVTLPDGAVLATWWERLFASLLDSLLVAVMSMVVAIPWLGEPMRIMGEYLNAAQAAAAAGAAPPDQAPFQAELAAALTPVQAIALGLTVLYQVLFLRWRAATPGKVAMGIVVRPVDGGRLSLMAILVRQVLGVVTFMLSFVAVLNLASVILRALDPAWLLWDPKRQALHDKLAQTVVVKAPRTIA